MNVVNNTRHDGLGHTKPGRNPDNTNASALREKMPFEQAFAGRVGKYSAYLFDKEGLREYAESKSLEEVKVLRNMLFDSFSRETGMGDGNQANAMSYISQLGKMNKKTSLLDIHIDIMNGKLLVLEKEGKIAGIADILYFENIIERKNSRGEFIGNVLEKELVFKSTPIIRQNPVDENAKNPMEEEFKNMAECRSAIYEILHTVYTPDKIFYSKSRLNIMIEKMNPKIETIMPKYEKAMVNA